MDYYMLTVPRTVHKKVLRIMIDANDCKTWIIGKEKGKNGYEHWQIRLGTSNKAFFDWVKLYIPTAHVEKATDTTGAYERKEGQYWTSADRSEVLQQRYGKLRKAQKAVLRALQATNDRQVAVWYDHTGCVGKSWFTGAMWERGLAYVTPATVDSVKGMIQYVASCYTQGGWRPYVIIDIPRSWKWSEQLYCAIESIKDGLFYDTRYNASMVNIRGVKVLVMTNTLPKLDALSIDRWVIIDNQYWRDGLRSRLIVTLWRLLTPPLGGVGSPWCLCFFRLEGVLFFKSNKTGGKPPVFPPRLSGHARSSKGSSTTNYLY